MNPSYQLVLQSADIPNLDMSNVAVAKYTSNLPTERDYASSRRVPLLLPWESRNLDHSPP